MTTEAQVQVAGTPAPVVSETQNTEPNTPEPTAGAGDVEIKEQETEKPTKTFTQAEVDALVQKRLLKEQRRTELKLQQQLRDALQAQPKEPPQREAFRDDDEFIKAQIEHMAEKRAEEKMAERQKRQEQERISSTVLEKVEQASERYEDFEAVVGNPALHINEAMTEFIAESDAGMDVAYYLGKNPIKAAQIAQMSPVKAAKELTRIEAELAKKPAPHQSSAPKPLTPTKGAASLEGLHPGLSDEEWIRRREKELRDRHK